MGPGASDAGALWPSRAATLLSVAISASAPAWRSLPWPPELARQPSGASAQAKARIFQSTCGSWVYNTMPYVGLILKKKQAAGIIDPEDNLPRGFAWRPKVNSRELQLPLLFNNPLSFAFFETKDGRMVTPTGLYPQHFTGFLNILGAPPDRAAIAAAIRQWDAEELDDKVGETGMVMAIHRTKDEWLAHPQGQYLATLPVIEIEKIGDGPPVPFAPNPTQPLSGIKVVSCSHVIASTTASRTLAEDGADVLHVARDQAFEHEGLIIDVNVGMRSTLLNLKDPSHADDLRALLKRTDVFVEGFRGRAMGGLGFGPEDVAEQRPGVVYLSCRAYGWNGPWWNRAAFDMEALTDHRLYARGGAGNAAFSLDDGPERLHPGLYWRGRSRRCSAPPGEGRPAVIMCASRSRAQRCGS